MISRKSNSLISRAYSLMASEVIDSFMGTTHFRLDELANFFYLEGYDDWFLDRMEKIETPTEFDEFIRGLQTGKSVREAFWNFKGDSLKVGQEILTKLATDILKVFIRRYTFTSCD